MSAQASVYENKILVQNCLQNEWTLCFESLKLQAEYHPVTMGVEFLMKAASKRSIFNLTYSKHLCIEFGPLVRCLSLSEPTQTMTWRGNL